MCMLVSSLLRIYFDNDSFFSILLFELSIYDWLLLEVNGNQDTFEGIIHTCINANNFILLMRSLYFVYYNKTISYNNISKYERIIKKT